MRSTRAVRGAIGIIGAVAVAELASRVGFGDATALPPVSTVLMRTGGLLGDTEFLGDVAATLTAWAGGILLAIALAVPAGLGLGSIPWLGNASRAVVEFLRPIPSVALIPLALIIFASTTNAKIALVTYAAVWPILVNTLYALRDVDPVAKEALRSFGFGSLSVLWRVTLPSAAPFVATGVRVATSVGLIVVISAELFSGGESGLGAYLLSTQSSGGHTDLLLAGAVWAGLLGLAVNAFLVWAERRAFRWHTARTESRT
ncbi:ABC transporter permease [Actinomadura scrupuli]|uniref:ABC transporter permease n=1 Tax=Actinomadura scrupuli TaxID=559629 RepID=UPI003D972C78